MTERSVDTMATLRDKQTFCLGAFDKYTMSHSRKGIPGLKELPIAGRLFGTENQVTRRSKIFVVVTPRFVNQVKFTGKVIEGTPPKLKDAPEPLGIEKAAMGSVDTNKILHD
jgi:type II secretory pathway component GspD/PulD (secretin)